MKDCWKSNPTERCKFGAIREDLKDSMFVDAIARETYHSIQPGTLQLVKGDEVVVVENTGQDWFGQNKKNQQFGTFPRSVVFARTNHAVATASAVTPQKVPTAPTIKVQQMIQPTVVPFSQKPSLNDRTSRISMPSRPMSAVINPAISTHSAHSIPELQHRLNAGNEMMRPRPASSIGIPHAHRPFSVGNVPTVQPPVSTSQQQNHPLQKALTDELKSNLSRRPTSAVFNGNGFQRNGVNQRSQSISQPPLQPQVLPANHASKLSQPVRLPPPVSPPTTSMIPPAQSVVNPRPAATSVTTAPVKTTSTPATSSTANGTSSSRNVVTRRTTQTVHMSEEERRSKIIQDVTSALPAPSALLYGSSSMSALPSPASQVQKERPHVTMPPKKTSEPILSSAVLQPTRLPSATTSVVKPASQPVPQPVINNRQLVITDKKPNMPSYPNYGNGYQPYGYGMHPEYSGYTGYNPYLSAANSLPPLVPSENRHSGTAQPLDDAAIMEFLGSQNHRQPAPVQASQASTQSSSRNNELSMKMKVLYKEADFTDSGNCDKMVMHCKGDTELALKLLKQNHLVQIGLARDTNRARQALESRQYDLTAAANLLLG
ncbi:hypothetical protein CAEBREN_13816 [Caenorhabditis brenneri]|uniref:UBA domain-containing protein n=1 Tax=Caenorhabditis brenneri TaxID=135651 RepID=G0P7V5_CAEBE|nr:hypothetical protein CAEBREN_13816 [Caenorhabditis brenneri]